MRQAVSFIDKKKKNKQYITLDNSCILLYTVVREERYAYIIINHTSWLYMNRSYHRSADIINGDMAPGTALRLGWNAFPCDWRDKSIDFMACTLSGRRGLGTLSMERISFIAEANQVEVLMEERRKSWNMIWMGLSIKHSGQERTPTDQEICVICFSWSWRENKLCLPRTWSGKNSDIKILPLIVPWIRCVTSGLIRSQRAGKSTTFKMLLGLVRPDSGEIRIFGKTKICRNDRREIGAVLSDLFPDTLTVAPANEFIGDFYPGFQKKEFEKQCLRFQLPVDKRRRNFNRNESKTENTFI